MGLDEQSLLADEVDIGILVSDFGTHLRQLP
jgi:hypothetical protein